MNSARLSFTSHKFGFVGVNVSVAREEWHRWFAWYPVIITRVGDPQFRAWLKFVERKWSPGTYTGAGKWRYRSIKLLDCVETPR